LTEKKSAKICGDMANGKKKLLMPKLSSMRREKSTVPTCDIQGAVTSKDYFTFRWLLDMFRLDSINDRFQESGKEPSWEGTVNSILINQDLKTQYKF